MRTGNRTEVSRCDMPTCLYGHSMMQGRRDNHQVALRSRSFIVDTNETHVECSDSPVVSLNFSVFLIWCLPAEDFNPQFSSKSLFGKKVAPLHKLHSTFELHSTNSTLFCLAIVWLHSTSGPKCKSIAQLLPPPSAQCANTGPVHSLSHFHVGPI